MVTGAMSKTLAVCLVLALCVTEASKLPVEGRQTPHQRGAATLTAPATASQHGLVEISLVLNQHSTLLDDDGSRPELLNPYLLNIDTTFHHAATNTKSLVHGFYDGSGLFKTRFSPPHQGMWTFSTTSTSLPALHAHSGHIQVTGALSRGCPRASPGNVGFAYPNGGKYSPIGTTCYAWLHQNALGASGKDPDEFEATTLRSLKASPFNKLRMTGFPKYYPFTHQEPRYYPFQGQYTPTNGSCHPPDYTDCGRSEWDFTRFNLSFWQHFDQRVAEVSAMGIVPEIILFHPYDDDHWG